MDIRKFFEVDANSSKNKSFTKLKSENLKTKISENPYSSDEELIINKRISKKRSKNVLYSDDEDNSTESSKLLKLTTNVNKDWKPITVSEYFKDNKIKRSVSKLSQGINTRQRFQQSGQSLVEKDCDKAYCNETIKNSRKNQDKISHKTISLNPKNKNALEDIVPGEKYTRDAPEILIPKPEPNLILKQLSPTKKKKFSNHCDKKQQSPKTIVKMKDNDPFLDKNKEKDILMKIEKTFSSPHHKSEEKLTDLSTKSENSDKKRERFVAYQKFLHREGPLHLGSKHIPQGEGDCLKGITFVLTGVLDSMERETAEDLVQRFGGRITHSVSKKTNYLISGRDAGVSKTNKAKNLNVKIITETELLNMIQEQDVNLSPMKSKRNLSESSQSCSKKKPFMKLSTQKECSDDPMNKEQNFHSTYENGLNNSLWVDKYKPVSSKQIIGQQGERSCVNKLKNWLIKWHGNREHQTQLSRPNPWSKNDNGAFYKAALLSGPPGIGKSTSAHIICRELNFDILELNASDKRSKRLLKDEVSYLLKNQKLTTGVLKCQGNKHVLIMDEVDGMTGNEDKGGISEIIQLIKLSDIPIICICNDRNNPKIRNLSNHCYDLRFSKPRIEQIKAAMLSICYKENINIAPDTLVQIINGTNHDLRQTLNYLFTWFSNKHNSCHETDCASKDIHLGPWDVVRKVFSFEEHKHMQLHERINLFFQDYSLGPLFVQENYLSVIPSVGKGNVKTHLLQLCKAADSISDADINDRIIHSQNNWSLLPIQAFFTSVIPGYLLSGHLTQQISFPTWFGKNSHFNKCNRLINQLQMHMSLKISATKDEVNMDYIPNLRRAIYSFLKHYQKDGVPDAVNLMTQYSLLREDLESINELCLWPGLHDPLSHLDTKVKSAFTRFYNKHSDLMPYTIQTNYHMHSARYLNEVNIENASEDSSEHSDSNNDIEEKHKDKKKFENKKTMKRNTMKNKNK